MARVLIIDDDGLTRETLAGIVCHLGHEVRTAETLAEGQNQALIGQYDVVLLDVRLPDGDGLSLLPDLKELPNAPEVIIITGYGDPDGAELAIRGGAWDYIEKSSSRNRINLSLARALQYRAGRQVETKPVALKKEGIIGEGPKMAACYDRLVQAAATNANVLLTGETGTGKELFAWAIHQNSARQTRPFIIVDCAALPETLTESVLFGHEKGAFTGADSTRIGLLKQADTGTLFLDEVGELPLSLQKAFLRAVDTKKFRPIGGQKEIESNFRLIAATNRNLEAMVGQGLFRPDLLFRLRAILIELPPLRHRLEDLKDLVVYHLGEICTHHRAAIKGFTQDFLEILVSYPWPGNVRELVHTLEMAYASALDEPILDAWHLPTALRVHAARAAVGQETRRTSGPGNLKKSSTEPAPNSNLEPLRKGESGISPADTTSELPTWAQFKEDNERAYLVKLLAETSGDMKLAAAQSGLSTARLYELLRKHNLTKTRSGTKP